MVRGEKKLLNTPEIKKIYENIQKKLFYMIPEKWESVYLYSSIIERINSLETGEMFFYYFPKSVIKKNPVNVYEIPARFNIDDDEYLKLADGLYGEIKNLRDEFINNFESPWSNVTISIANFKFRIEFNYENLNDSEYTNYERHLIWKYRYLQVPLTSFNKKERQKIEQYLIDTRYVKTEVSVYEEAIYKKPVKNIINYNKEDKEEEVLPEKEFRKPEIKDKPNDESMKLKSQILKY